ncbi:Signal transduction histidine kinase involved in nitrogen fixation and metabolism regulation [Paramagnetospirillum caucaseum]|uniref:Nitrogen regulation protein n=1 Tax=Paramagnetospirillum caucaseum TaxID=1244869 RepID=M2ZR54_9PROT|nr:PAS domain-containing sensor histidine kinase [Paramagnetospirillum caucaseum]EME69807.1 Signal transduction histidine kinase involved in nitrogen fixation and metabolism regulation [Paramagnetospirillum caucaseum]
MAFGRRIRHWARRVDLARRLAYGLTFASIPAIVATVWVMGGGGGGPTGPDPRIVLSLLATDGVLLAALGGVVGYRVLDVLKARRRGASGSRLHLRFIMLFALVAVTPSVLMSVGSTAFFRYGVESWFSDRVRTALQASLEVAHAYLEEHKRIIGGDALAMANDINREGLILLRSPQHFGQFVGTQAAIRGLTEAIVFDTRGNILARSGLIFAVEASIDQIPAWALDKARGGDVVVLSGSGEDRVKALVQLQGLFGDTFLYVGRFVDPKVIGYMAQTSEAVAQYERLEGRLSGLERAFSLIFALVALLLVLTAIWVGLSMAVKLATPIGRLIDAAEKVRSGDLDARVAEDAADEIGVLSRAFNRMTHQLSSQRQDLVDANRELDERRRFTETVLAGVSSGVIGLDALGRIHLPNRSAGELIGVNLDEQVGNDIRDVIPDLAEPLDEAVRRPDKLVQREVRLSTPGGRSRMLLVRVAAERLESEIIGYVVTFDDITELVSAQRKAAWADVARRIAHEIKNPLTPIQLSAERLKRKYLKEIHSDPETYVNLVETIVRQVGDIGRMVDEFSSFARMPAPQIRADDLNDICRQAVFLQKTGNPGVEFVHRLPEGKVLVQCDGRLIGQALTNLLKNAVEAIQGRDDPQAPPGRIVLSLEFLPDRLAVTVEDNGKGLPTENRERLTEPYVTTRTKGTGLGLAIVKKIMEDHGGDLYLEDAPGGGARIGLVFPAPEQQQSQATGDTTATHGA